ncbi:MAG: arylsulfatase, partial [Acidimicrobiia bacterium]
ADHTPHPTSRRYVYRLPMSPIPGQATASAGGRSFDLTARITRHDGDEGVIWATGTENSGISVFVQDGRLVVDYNAFDDHTVVESDRPVPTGDVELHVRLERDSRTTGRCEIAIDGEPAGRADIAFYMRMISSVGASVGYDHGSPVSTRYTAPFPFTGTLHEVVIQLPQKRDAADVAAAQRAEMSRQ